MSEMKLSKFLTLRSLKKMIKDQIEAPSFKIYGE